MLQQTYDIRIQHFTPQHAFLRDTIICIIEEFFNELPNIMLYMCETGDKRQKQRARLFARWFNTNTLANRFEVRTAMVEDEDTENYVAMIVAKDNPRCQQALETFEEQINLFRANK